MFKFLRPLVNCHKTADPETDRRRKKLQTFAKQEFKQNNKAEVLASITEYGIELVKELPNPSKTLIADMKSVLIGRNMTVCRGAGAYFAGNIDGSEGFKKELQDPWNQIQHATAGMVIAFQYGRLAELMVRFLEHEPQDIRLYDVTFPLGEKLNDDNLSGLPDRIREAIEQKKLRHKKSSLKK